MKLRDVVNVALLLVVIIAAQGVVERIERDTELRLALAGAYREGCLPAPGETAIVTRDGGRADCRIFASASLAPGMAPRLLNVAAVEVEP